MSRGVLRARNNEITAELPGLRRCLSMYCNDDDEYDVDDDIPDDVINVPSLTSLPVLAAADEYDEATCVYLLVHVSGAACDDVTVEEIASCVAYEACLRGGNK